MTGSWPALQSSTQVWDPIKPAPPVRRIFITVQFLYIIFIPDRPPEGERSGIIRRLQRCRINTGIVKLFQLRTDVFLIFFICYAEPDGIGGKHFDPQALGMHK